MADEYACLAEDAGRDGPAFARAFFGERQRVPNLLLASRARIYRRTYSGEAPDVANIWIGGRRSRTSLHKGR